MDQSIAQDLVARAEALAPLFAERAAESEQLRRPADDAMQAAEEAGLFRLMVPHRYGGFELDMDTFVEVVLPLAEGDASLAWVTAFLIEHNWMFCLFPQAFQEELFADRSYVLAPGIVAPTGVAQPVDGGVELTGRWQFGTGVTISSWVIAGAIRLSEDGQPDPRFFAMPIEDVTVEDTWHVDGMCGTGSHDVVVDKVFVPEERSVSILAMNQGNAPGADIHDGPLYRTPMIPLLCATAAMPALGQARALVREYAERLPARSRMGLAPPPVEQSAHQARLGRLDIQVRQAELLLRDTVRELCQRRNTCTVADRVRMQAQLALVVAQSKQVISEVCGASGAKAHALTDAMQRARRDVEVMSCHVAFDTDTTLENAGRALLGLELSALA